MEWKAYAHTKECVGWIRRIEGVEERKKTTEEEEVTPRDRRQRWERERQLYASMRAALRIGDELRPEEERSSGGLKTGLLGPV